MSGRIAVDMQGAQIHWQRGVSRYSIEHLRALLSAAPDSISFIRVNPGLRIPEELFELDVRMVEWGIGDPPPQPVPAIYHLTSSFDRIPLAQLWPGWARRPGVKTVVTLYDLIPYLFSQDYLPGWPARVSYAIRLGLLHAFDHLLPISRVTAEDAVRCLDIDPDRLSVISAGVDPDLPRLVLDRASARRILDAELPEVRGRFLLYVGGGDSRKNLKRLIEAYALLSPELRSANQLVIVCDLEPGAKAVIDSWIEEAGVAGDVGLTGHVTDPQLVALYRECHLFVFPSIYEGFGLPILEAAACGAPVLASDTPCSREVLGDDYPVAFDPLRPPAISTAIERVLGDDKLLTELSALSEGLASRFTWRKVAEQTLAAYEVALTQRSPSRVAAALAFPKALGSLARAGTASIAEDPAGPAPLSDGAVG